MCKQWLIVSAAIAASLAPSFAHADRFVLKNGRALEGDVVSEDTSAVNVRTWVSTGTIVQRLKKAHIESWDRVVGQGKSFMVVPLFGTIGEDATVDGLRAGLLEAQRVNPDYVILAIDSLGGRIDQMTQMLDLLDEASRTMHIVAYVKQAYSAAAVIAISCPELYMKPSAAIGATVPFRVSETGPEEVDAKFRSVIYARMRAASEHGQRSELFVRGMSELDLELYLSDSEGKTTLSDTGPGHKIKGRGQILTLTAEESERFGLAVVAPTIAELGQRVCDAPWYEASRMSINATLGTVAAQKQRERQLLEQQERAALREAAIAAIKPEWDANERRITVLAARADATRGVIMELDGQLNREIERINGDYRRTINDIEIRFGPLPTPPYTGNGSTASVIEYNDRVRYMAERRLREKNEAIALATDNANQRVADARAHVQATAAPLRADLGAAELELRSLFNRRDALLASIPED